MSAEPRSLFPSLRKSAEAILADNGEWTAGDARACAAFVLAAQDEFQGRVEKAREALSDGDEAVVSYLLGDCPVNTYGSTVHEFDSNALGAKCRCGEVTWEGGLTDG